METSCAIQGAVIMTGHPDAARFPSGFPAGGEENWRPALHRWGPGRLLPEACRPARHPGPASLANPRLCAAKPQDPGGVLRHSGSPGGGAPGHGHPGFPMRGVGALPGNAPPSCAPENARAILRGPPDLLAPSAASGGCRKGVPARRSSPSVLRGGIPRHLPQQGNCLLSITQEGRRVTSVLPLYGRNAM